MFRRERHAFRYMRPIQLCQILGLELPSLLTDLQASLSGLDSCNISCHATTDDDQVLVLCGSVSANSRLRHSFDATDQLPTQILVVIFVGGKCWMRRVRFETQALRLSAWREAPGTGT